MVISLSLGCRAAVSSSATTLSFHLMRTLCTHMTPSNCTVFSQLETAGRQGWFPFWISNLPRCILCVLGEGQWVGCVVLLLLAISGVSLETPALGIV